MGKNPDQKEGTWSNLCSIILNSVQSGFDPSLSRELCGSLVPTNNCEDKSGMMVIEKEGRLDFK